ncbi:uncharacterized protein LOC119117915 [Syngnathus acus]|uniref:uncharacterized protein LOC119117915 n=1 Tax=Syngnathus acus TaxID=161584 RepID=UPI001885D042|nr:uncharacterized protein LOC119117915 [Syngnathus acus]
MTGWVSSGTLLLVLMAGAALCHPVRKALGPRSFPRNRYPPQTLLHQLPRQEFPQQHRVAESRFPAVKTDAGSAGDWNYGIEQPVPIPEIPSNAENLPDMVDFSAQTVLGGVEVPELPVTDSVLPVDPEGLGSVPILPPRHPEFQPGELFRLEKTFEHGDYESEHETQGAPQPPPFYQPLPVPVDLPQRVSPLPPNFFPPPRPDVPYPFDYYFLMGHYPPGTATHFSSTYERGRNYNQDLHYEKNEQSEPQWPWVNTAGPLRNPEQAAIQRRVPNDRLNSASTFDYGRYNQPKEVELPPRYYNTYNPPQVKLTPRFYRRWGGQ